MKNYSIIFLTLVACHLPFNSFSQVNENQIGGWYMFFWNKDLKEKQFGFQGDVQYRNWNIVGDLEQLLLRGGLTYRPKNVDVKFTLGFANVQSGQFGLDNSINYENRIYQEALFPSKLGTRIYFNHRFRYEQRLTHNQNIRTRYRYNLFVNIPLNNSQIKSNTLYISIYNEIFINGQKDIGFGNSVEIFDRNRFYLAVGYAINTDFKIQLGMMNQSTNTWRKNQLQLSLHCNY